MGILSIVVWLFAILGTADGNRASLSGNVLANAEQKGHNVLHVSVLLHVQTLTHTAGTQRLKSCTVRPVRQG